MVVVLFGGDVGGVCAGSGACLCVRLLRACVCLCVWVGGGECVCAGGSVCVRGGLCVCA